MSLLDLEKDSFFDSDFGDSDEELDLKSIYSNPSAPASPTHTSSQPHRSLLYSSTAVSYTQRATLDEYT